MEKQQTPSHFQLNGMEGTSAHNDSNLVFEFKIVNF